MNYRLSTLHPTQTYDENFTEIVDINVKDPISAIILNLTVDNSSSIAPTAHALACLTKLELVDGSDVLFSLSGYEADALDWYCNHVTRSNWNAYLGGMACNRVLGINFGRYLWDPVLALDPTKFDNLQLKFTLAYQAGGITPANNKVTVLAALFDEKTVTPTGFLMAKEIKDYTMASNSHEYTDLPTDFVYRKLLVRCQYPGHEPGALLRSLKLSEDQDKRVIFDHRFTEIMRSMSQNSPMYHETILGIAMIAGNYQYCTPTERVFGTINRWESSVGAGETAFYDGDGGRCDVTSQSLDSNCQIDVQGWCPHGVYEIPFGLQGEIEDWFDVTKIGSLRADILSKTAASSDDSLQIFLQQLRNYA